MTNSSGTADLGQQPPHVQEAHKAAAPRDAKSQQIYNFEVNWTAPNGDTFTGQFAHKAPTVGDVVAIELDRAKRLAAVGDEDKISDRALQLIGMMAHMERTLTERPSWARDLNEIPYSDLFNVVAQEVSTHVETFCVGRDGKAHS